MSNPDRIQALVSEAAELLSAPQVTGVPYATALHAAFWPYVSAAAEQVTPAETPPEAVHATPADRRTRLWQVTLRFWATPPAGPELVAETDPAVIEGTGGLPAAVADTAAQLHGEVPAALDAEHVRPTLPQLRNNLGRRGAAVLRLPYVWEEQAYLCQVDVVRLDHV
jgi:hypothetical protein